MSFQFGAPISVPVFNPSPVATFIPPQPAPSFSTVSSFVAPQPAPSFSTISSFATPQPAPSFVAPQPAPSFTTISSFATSQPVSQQTSSFATLSSFSTPQQTSSFATASSFAIGSSFGQPTSSPFGQTQFTEAKKGRKGRSRKDKDVETKLEYKLADYNKDMKQLEVSNYRSKRGKTSYAMMLFRCKQNQINMMKKRGYDISVEELKILDGDYTVVDFIKYFKERMLYFSEQLKLAGTFKKTLSTTYINSNRDKPCHVIFAETFIDPNTNKIKRLTGSYVSSFRNKQNENDDFIVIGDLPLDKSGLKSFRNMNIQYFLYEELMVNVIDSILSPEYIIMNSKEISNLLTSPENNIKNIEQLQHISYEDIIVKYLGLKVGDVIKIIRTNYQIETLVTTTIAYRLVYPVKMTLKENKNKDKKKGKIDKDAEDEYGEE